MPGMARKDPRIRLQVPTVRRAIPIRSARTTSFGPPFPAGVPAMVAMPHRLPAMPEAQHRHDPE